MNVGVNSALGVKIKDMNGNNARDSNTAHPVVNARVGLSIHLELVYRPAGKWDVAWANVTNTEAHTQAQDKPPSRQV